MAAGATYTPIASYTVSGSSTTTITFSSFAGYTDIRLVIVGGDPSNNGAIMRFNNSNTAYYSATYLGGNGTSALTGRNTNQTGIYSLGFYENTPTTVTEIVTLDIMNYANSTTFKTWLIRSNNAASALNAGVGLWRGSAGSAEAITRIDLIDSANFASGTTASIYGITAA